MSSPITSFRDIIDRWPARASLAADLGLTPDIVRDWYRRDSIPAWRFDAVIDAAATRDFPGVTYTRLTELKKQAKEIKYG